MDYWTMTMEDRKNLLIDAVANFSSDEKLLILIQLAIRVIEAGEPLLEQRPDAEWAKNLAAYKADSFDDPLPEMLDYMY